jgi:sensor c-di-GMP phosphodiesterase-like protein
MLVALVTLAGVLPPGLFIGVSWFQAVRDMDTQLARYAATSLERADEIFDSAELTLTQMSRQLEPRCSDATMQAMGRIILDSIYFHEATVVSNGAVICTNLGRLEPPVPVSHPENAMVPASGIHISPPLILARENLTAIVIHYRGGDDVMFGLHLNPRLLGEAVNKSAAEDQVSLALERSDGTVLSQFGLQAARPLRQLDGHRVVLESKRYPVRVIAVGSPNWIKQNWKQNVLTYASIGLLTSAGLFVLLLVTARHQFSIAASLEDALAEGQFEVYYQPVIDAVTGGCSGAESLLRWKHPQLGLITPDAFVPAAEKSGFIITLTQWLMRRIAADLSDLLREHPDFHIAVNVSPQHFADRGLLADIKRMIGQRVAPGQIVIEVTEHELIMSEDHKALETLQGIRALGTPIALDDFGSGYSSLRYLSSFPFDYLKIDKAFIDAIGTESLTAGLVDTIVSMARQFKLKIVAEGVETPAQLAYLQNLKVDYVQGWLFSKALPAAEFHRFYATNHSYMLGLRAGGGAAHE